MSMILVMICRGIKANMSKILCNYITINAFFNKKKISLLTIC